MFLPLFRNLPGCSRNVTHRLKRVVSSSVNKANFRLRTFCVSGKICQIQSDQAFETLGFASLRIYYWSRRKLAIFPWERKNARRLIQILWSYSGGHNAELEIWISARRNITISPPLWERCARWKEAEGGLPAMHTSQSEFDFVTVLNVTVVHVYNVQ